MSVISCQCCSCEHGDGTEGCAALWAVTGDWRHLPHDSLPKRIQRWIDSWGTASSGKPFRGVDHGDRGFHCPPPLIGVCPGFRPHGGPDLYEWDVYLDGDESPFRVIAPTKEQAIEIVREVEGDDVVVRVESSPPGGGT